MSHKEAGNIHLHHRTTRRCGGLRKRGGSLAAFANAAKPVELAGNENVANALRRREDAFNEDILPSDVELRAPRDFYAAIRIGCRLRSPRRSQLEVPQFEARRAIPGSPDRASRPLRTRTARN